MIKTVLKIALFNLLISPPLALAQRDSTQVEITPDSPYYCKVTKDRSDLSMVWAGQLISENEAEIVVQFRAAFGECKGGQFYFYDITKNDLKIDFMDMRTMWPWEDAPYSLKYAVYGSHPGVFARVTFQRAAILDSRAEASLRLDLQRIKNGRHSYTYPWILRILRTADGKTIINFAH